IVRDATVLEEQDARATVQLGTVEDYYGLVGSEKRREVALEATANSRERQTRARAFYEVGNVPRGDVSKATRDLAQAELDSISAENAVAVARARLAGTMGLDPETPIEVVSDLESPSSFAPSGASDLASAPSIADVKTDDLVLPPSVVDARPDVRALRARAAAADARRSTQ